MKRRLAGQNLNRLADQFCRHLMPAALARDDPKQMEGPRVTGMLRQHLPIDCLGLRQPSGLMVPNCNLKSLIDCDLRHEDLALSHDRHWQTTVARRTTPIAYQ